MGQKTYVVGGLGFGDEGKGTIVDYLTRTKDIALVVRYSGGAQCGHNVITPNGESFCFHQFGSGTLVPGVHTYLSNFVLFNPMLLVSEEKQLRALGISDGYSRLHVAKNAMVTTPYHIYANRLEEFFRGNAKHGSCGVGIGKTVEYALHSKDLRLYVQDLLDKDKLRDLMTLHRSYTLDTCQEFLKQVNSKCPQYIQDVAKFLEDPQRFEDTLTVYHEVTRGINVAPLDFLDSQKGNIVFEGAQGVLLDEMVGFAPHNTWSNTTSGNALRLIKDSKLPDPEVIGVIRAYTTRHGAGPFPTEDSFLTSTLGDINNPTNNWQGNFRSGWLDLVLLKYALRYSRVDSLAVTNLDTFEILPERKVCVNYEGFAGYSNVELNHKLLCKARPVYQGLGYVDMLTYLDYISCRLNKPISIESWGPTWQDKIVKE